MNVVLFGDTTHELIAGLLMLTGAAGLWMVQRRNNPANDGPATAH